MRKRNSILFATLMLSLCSCSSSIYIERPEDTNLEFWITERVAFEDLENKGCTFLPGWFGADEYLDSRYQPIQENDMNTKPDISVTYLVGGYPDTLDERTIVQIEITDPEIYFYGLSLNSTSEEIQMRMKEEKAKKISDNVYRIGRVDFGFNVPHSISMRAKVTNKHFIVY